MKSFNIYCDESCHLEHDGKKVMVLGAIWMPTEAMKEVSMRISQIKQKHGLHPHAEIKWTKVCKSKQELYLDLVNYFFDEHLLHFRALVAPKEGLRHDEYNQSHDKWYYKMYFDMLKIIFSPTDKYFVYLDIKDSRGGTKVKELHDVLCNNIYDFNREIISRIQIIRSEESQIMQLADVLIGVLSYVNRDLSANPAKMALVKAVRACSNYDLTKSTLWGEEKFNIFCWRPSGANQ